MKGLTARRAGADCPKSFDTKGLRRLQKKREAGPKPRISPHNTKGGEFKVTPRTY